MAATVAFLLEFQRARIHQWASLCFVKNTGVVPSAPGSGLAWIFLDRLDDAFAGPWDPLGWLLSVIPSLQS